jgi:hypothetical protein
MLLSLLMSLQMLVGSTVTDGIQPRDFFTLVTITLQNPKADRKDWPTEAEVKATILKIEYDINASETNKKIWKVKNFRHEVKSVKFADTTIEKQMRVGARAQTVYPVKVLYTQITDYESKATTREPVGEDGVWFFYKDSFGKWTAKYGKE